MKLLESIERRSNLDGMDAFLRPRRRGPAWSWLGALALSASLLGCGGGGDGGDGGAADGSDATIAECEAQSYPCLWKDVAPGVVGQTVQLGSQLDTRLRGGESVADAVKWLKGAVPDVVVVHDERALRFRLANGRPVWVMAPGALPPAAASVSPAGEFHPLARAAAAGGVVGRDRAEKSALLLDPYAFHLGGQSSAGVAALLADTPGYEGRVERRANNAATDVIATVGNFREFDLFDVIYLNVPTGRLCHDQATNQPISPCKAGMLAQRVVTPEIDLLEAQSNGVELLFYEGHADLFITRDFFKAAYPQGLTNKLIYVDGVDSAQLGLDTAMRADGSVFVGWTGFVNSDETASWSTQIFGHLQRGFAFARALVLASESLPASSDAALAPSGGDIRIRELITAYDAGSGDVLIDGGGISLLTAAGDGQPDKVKLAAVLDGIDAEHLNDFVLTVELDGVALAQWSAASGQSVSDTRWRVEGELALGIDTQAGQSLPLRLRLALPEGGESTLRVAPKVVDAKQMPAEWTMHSTTTVSGVGTTELVTTTVRWQLDHVNDQTYFYKLVGGQQQWVYETVLGGCTYHGAADYTVAADEGDSYLRIDTGTQPMTVSGYGNAEGVTVQVKGQCDTGESTFSTQAGAPFFSATGLEIDSNQGFVGKYSSGASIGTVIDFEFSAATPGVLPGATAFARR